MRRGQGICQEAFQIRAIVIKSRVPLEAEQQLTTFYNRQRQHPVLKIIGPYGERIPVFEGLGATVLRSCTDGKIDIVFINTKNKSKKQRRIISEYLGANQSGYTAEIQ